LANTDKPNLQDRREYFRVNFKTPVEFRTYPSKAPQAQRGSSQNISQSGILFQTENIPPQLSSLVWMNLDIRTLSICKEIERKALVLNNGLVGKVVRVEEDADNMRLYDIGVCFLTRDKKESSEIKEIAATLVKTSQ